MKLPLLFRQRSVFGFAAFALATSGFAAACSSGDSSSTTGGDTAADAAPPDGGSEAAPNCQPQAWADDPEDTFTDANCDGIDGDKSRAIFVAPSGNDTAAGSFDAPVKTLGNALALAASAKKDVYVCDATYAENVTMTAPVNVYAGYDCANGWQRGNSRATVAPPKGVPFTLRDVHSEHQITIDRLALHAPDGVDPSESSIALFASKSSNITFTHASLLAGNGADGASPAAPVALSYLATSGLDGSSLPTTSCAMNNSNPPIACDQNGIGALNQGIPPACESRGGNGGNGGNLRESLGDASGELGAPPGVGGGTPGANGSNGADGANGVAATSGVGTVTADGYIASNAGTDGQPAQAGGGGAGGSGGGARYANDGLFNTYWNGGGGGSGGYGGCAGGAAKGGGAGGGSFGVVAFQSDLSLWSSEIQTGNGGRGGRSVAGAAGQLGGMGGKGGAGTASPGNGQNGGNGGRGGHGGTGGAGGGGPSVGTLLINSNASGNTTMPLIIHIGKGGKGGSGAGATEGADGIAQETFTLDAADGGVADSGADAH